MDSTAPISVLVGKAVLTPSGLYVNDIKTDLQDSSQFSALVMTTQAIIAQALTEAFADDFGEFVGDGDGHYTLAPGLAPWEQYVQSSLKIGTAEYSCEIVVGWCTLLHLLSKASACSIDPKAAMVAGFIVKQAAWSMYVCPSELEAWLAWNASRNPFASDLEQIRHEEMRPADPFRKRRTLSVPWIEKLGVFSVLDEVRNSYGDILISVPKQIASLQMIGDVMVYGHFLSRDLIPADHPDGDFVMNVDHKGDSMKFRARSDGNRAVLRLLPKTAPRLAQGAMQ